jgi:hypothetical protein
MKIPSRTHSHNGGERSRVRGIEVLVLMCHPHFDIDGTQVGTAGDGARRDFSLVSDFEVADRRR